MAKYLDENGAEQLNLLLANKFNSKMDCIELTSPVRIWDLDEGVYKLPQSCVIYYKGASSTASTSINSGAYLYVFNYNNNYKGFYCFYEGQYGLILLNGSTTASSGSITSKAVSNFLISISNYVKDNLTYSTSGTTYALSAYQGYLLDQNKQDKLTAGTNITIDENNVISASGGSGGTSDYTDLTNKPSINNVTLSGNKSLSDLGIGSTITELTDSTIYIWNLDPGIYKLPSSGYVVYYGTSTSSSYKISVEGGYLLVTPLNSGYKHWIMFKSNDDAGRYLWNGYTTSSGGAKLQFNIGTSYLYNISSYVKDNLTYSTSGTTYALSAYQGYLLDQNKADKTEVPTITYSDTDLTPGTSALATGTFYFVYE